MKDALKARKADAEWNANFYEKRATATEAAIAAIPQAHASRRRLELELDVQRKYASDARDDATAFEAALAALPADEVVT